LLGPHAVAAMHGIIYFMSTTNFYRIGAGGSAAQPIPSTVWDEVYSDIDTTNQHKATVGTDALFNEVFFFYPSVIDGTGECSRYAKFNILEGVWDLGTLPRSAWIDVSVLHNPIGADPSTTLLQAHESGMNADNVAMNSWFETGYFAIGEGEDFAFVDQVHPDAKWRSPIASGSSTATITLTLSTQRYPNEGIHMTDALTMTSTTAYLPTRLRGRQMKFRWESSDLGSFWRMGMIRYRVAVDGRR
jgi:hypothetical protein